MSIHRVGAFRSGQYSDSSARPWRLNAFAIALSLIAFSGHAAAADEPPVEAPTEVAAADSSDQLAAAAGGSIELETVVVTGNRGSARHIADSPVPIDVIGGEQLENLGGSSGALKDALEKLAPSFVVNTRGNATWGTVSKPAGLRGLSGAHVLVLVNGKRRHNSALPTMAADSQAINANPVDLDFIPLSAIDHIEILRDGAAAQYGSDAIAGVINVILKTADSGGSVSTTLGQRYQWRGRQDGETALATANDGFKLGDSGYFNFAADARHQNWTLRNAPSTQSFYFKQDDGSADPRESVVDKTKFRGGTPKIESFNLSFNTALPLDNGITPYAFGSFGRRDAELGQSFRLATTTNVIPELLTGVVLTPTTYLSELDWQLATGVKAQLSDWNWDLSATYGKNRVDLQEKNSVNPSLGLDSPSDFATFTPIFEQLTTNLDLTRPVDIGWSAPLQVSVGAEHRYERFQTVVRDPLAYGNGGYVFPDGPLAGQPGAIGAQAAVLVLPEDAADIDRQNVAAYVDFGLDVTPKWYVGTAGRFEHYDDSAGDTWSGKLTSRYAFTPELALRGTVSNGFRAPSLSQIGFASGSQGPFIVNGQIAGVTTSRNATPDSALGKALGATALKPEKSLNASLGLSWQPIREVNVEVDAYQILLDDRIARTTTFRGTGVSQILSDNGFDPNQSVSYNTNGIDTKTQGIDVVASYLQRLNDHGFGTLRYSAGFNYNKTTIEHIKDTPQQLADLGLTLYDRVAQSYLTKALPKTKTVLGVDWQIAKLDINLRGTRYGAVSQLTDSPASDQHYKAKWIADLDIGYAVTDALTFAIGANNLFDTYPDKSTIPDAIGAQLYATNSPFGSYGGFYYARAVWSFN
jgi:iron complex outermembrane receptor protein